ncbi:hypothetical protein CAOEGIBSW744_0131 [Cardinium endosymbiont of Oedothorax gibbosus]|nr:hypothetical protein CAOEGIBSW744_0131 [Cardinium endosymbiont of Oedothorax gibbosus]
MHPGRQEGEMEVNGKDETTIHAYRIRWYHASSIYFERDQDTDDLEQSGYDPKGMYGFTGKGMTLAAQLLVAMDLQQLRIGAGVGIRYSFLERMEGQWVHGKPSDDDQNKENKLLAYIPARPYYFTWTPLLRLGFKLIENQNYDLLIDGTWAPCTYHFSELGKSGHWHYSRNGDLGGTWKKQITRCIYWSLRVAYGFCFNNELIEPYEPSSPDHLLSVSHYIDGIMAQVGISIRIPGLSKCPIVGCHTTLDHMHGGKQYRGDRLLTGLW